MDNAYFVIHYFQLSVLLFIIFYQNINFPSFFLPFSLSSPSHSSFHFGFEVESFVAKSKPYVWGDFRTNIQRYTQNLHLLPRVVFVFLGTAASTLILTWLPIGHCQAKISFRASLVGGGETLVFIQELIKITLCFYTNRLYYPDSVIENEVIPSLPNPPTIKEPQTHRRRR